MKKLLSRPRALRQNMTLAEVILWQHLRRKQLSQNLFRRQHPIGPYIVDFVSLKSKLVIECDGGQHSKPNIDLCRDRYLQANGFRVLRFWNHEVLNQTSEVVMKIKNVLEGSE